MTKAEITINRYDDSVCIKLDLDGEVSWHDLRLPEKEEDGAAVWIMQAIKPVFLNMPVDNIKLICPKPTYENMKESMDFCAGLLQRTNQFIKQNPDLKDIAKDHEELLFFNVSEELRYKSFYDRLKRKGYAIHYMNVDVGFDRKNREWTKEKELPLSLPELIEFIKTNRIKILLTVNYYLAHRYSSIVGVSLLTILNYLGVECMTINNDPPDLQPPGYLHRLAFNNPNWRQFSNLGVLNRYWDEKYGMDNVQYIAIPQDYRPAEIKSLDDDYAIIILSNSRWDNVKASQTFLDHFLGQMPQDSLFENFQLWYMTLRYMVLNIMELTEFEKLKFNSILHQFFYVIANYLKYEIIRWLPNGREIKLYGDLAWKELFPQYYQGSLSNDEIDELFRKDNQLYLLLNFGFSYLDASAPVYDMVRRNVPFINVPPLVTTDTFKGLKHIEYSSKEELNSLLSNIQNIYKVKELQDALGFYSGILSSSVDDIERALLNRRQRSEFNAHLRQHELLLDFMIENYLKENESFLRTSFEGIFREQL